MPQPPKILAFNLFWRTFALLAALLAGAVFAWQLTFRALDAEPRALESAHQLAGLVNLCRAAMATTDGVNRVAMIKSLTHSRDIQVEIAEPTDQWVDYGSSSFTRQLVQALQQRLGGDTVVAGSLNGEAGLWVRFSIDTEHYWLRTNPEPMSARLTANWWWLLIALLVTILGSALIARLINHPLRELATAAGRIREGEYDSRLDESTLTSEIREVNMGFNRMARDLAKMEEDRSVMLAGISHDLRTPLARLRLEAEMSVTDEQARLYMAQDIDQLDAIINKFMDYARPSELALHPIKLRDVAEREAQGFRDPSQIRIQNNVPADIKVWADEVELGRIFLNIMENARRYGHLPDLPTLMLVTAKVQGAEVLLTLRDHGPGVPQDKLDKLTTPFFRGDAARTAATGAGLGLAIVEKSVQRQGGKLSMRNADDGGLVTQIRLRRAQ
ncbi:HAMP domain-containing protein [Mitsuaria sp. WAJ17]|uniref:ATP-binding protein n=1 Tax=Mitsuaria sp. WAJ17 TaxID=2761452 RepID=UPI001602A688|nr:ATP-binding protein [Mitsuaria sp. WAJ17]MBB2485501.1 HAMP domain-containing protein [Mitsuaria sp. WAJ17]